MFKNLLRRAFPPSVRHVFKKQTFLISAGEIEEAAKTPGLSLSPDSLRQVERKVHISDDMYSANNGLHYIQVGLSALQCIEMAMADLQVGHINEVLDMPSGYGRGLRILARRFPKCRFTAADTDRTAVDFCRKTFGATPAYSCNDLDGFNIGRQFDLIWCGSLATHLNSEGFTALMRFFHRHLATGGLLVFSMHGTFSFDKLKSHELNYGISPNGVATILRDYNRTGYGYADYPDSSNYGISLASTEWVNKCLAGVGTWSASRFYPVAWSDHHDIYAAVKA